MDKEKSRARRERKPFYDRFWWLPAAIMGLSIVVSVLALLIAARRQ